MNGVPLSRLAPREVPRAGALTLGGGWARSGADGSQVLLPRTLVIAAARLAGTEEFSSRMPLGYDTMIEERGANLSGGQRQRIAIARALVTQHRAM
jgi:hypothetical protein